MTATSPIFSSLVNDPDLGELVEMYVDEMPERISQMKESLEDKDKLLRLIHQIKGAAGSYGFDELSAQAGRHENEIESTDDFNEIKKCVDEFALQCQRVTTRVP